MAAEQAVEVQPNAPPQATATPSTKFPGFTSKKPMGESVTAGKMDRILEAASKTVVTGQAQTVGEAASPERKAVESPGAPATMAQAKEMGSASLDDMARSLMSTAGRPVSKPILAEGTAAGDAPPAEAPVGAPDPMDLIEAPAEVSTDAKARNAWAALKHEAKQYRTEARELKPKVVELETKLRALETAQPVATDEVQALKAKVTEYEDKLGKLDITQSPAFQSRYIEPLQQKYGQMVSLLQRAGQEAPAAQALAEKIVGAGGDLNVIQNLMAEFDLSIPVQATVIQQADTLVEMVRQRDTAVQHWRETHAALADTSTREQTIQNTQAVVEHVDKAVQKLTESGNWLLTETPTNVAWNKQRDELVNASRVVLREGRPEEIAQYVLAGMTADKYRVWGMQEHQRAEALEAEMTQIVRARPGLGAGATETSAAPAERPKSADPTKWLDENLKKVTFERKR